MSLVLGVLFCFFSGPRSLQYKAEHLGWSGSLLLQTEAALIGDYSREQIYYRYVLYMTPLQKTRIIPLTTALETMLQRDHISQDSWRPSPRSHSNPWLISCQYYLITTLHLFINKLQNRNHRFKCCITVSCHVWLILLSWPMRYINFTYESRFKLIQETQTRALPWHHFLSRNHCSRLCLCPTYLVLMVGFILSGNSPRSTSWQSGLNSKAPET